jgi:hypothetical protein
MTAMHWEYETMRTVPTRRWLSFHREPATRLALLKILFVVGALLFLGGMALSAYYKSVPSEANWMVGNVSAIRHL